MKNLTLKIITFAALLTCGNAQAFDLAGISAADIRASRPDLQVPAARPAASGLIGFDLNVRVPFATFKKAVVMAAAKEPRLSVLDEKAPVAFKSGDFLKLTNIQVNQGGIIVNPTLTLKPYLASTDKLAIRIERVQLHAAMEPTVKAAQIPQISQEQIMEQVMDVLIKTVYTSVDGFLKSKELPLTADKVLKLTYDKDAWTLYGAINSKEMHNLISPALVGEMRLTGFSFNEKGLAITVKTAE